MSHHVFISYSSLDVEQALGVRNYLEDNGMKCWMAPRDISPGAHYASSILEAIKKSNIFVLVFSSNSDSSEQVLKEVDRAVDYKIPIIPFRIESHMPSEAMEYYLCNTHWLNAYDNIIEKYYDELRSSCQQLVNISNSSPVRNIPNNSIAVSGRLKSIIEQMKEDAIREEKEGVEYLIKQNEDKEIVRKQDRKNAEAKKIELLQKAIEKKKRENNQIINNKIIPQRKEKPKEKSKKYFKEIIFFVAIVTVLVFLYGENKEKEYQFIKSVDHNKIEDGKVERLNYQEIIKVFFEREYFEKSAFNDLKLLEGTIESKNGELFERVGHDLVEKKSNKYEIHNLLLIKSILNDLRAEQREIQTINARVTLNASVEGSLSEVENQWLLSLELQRQVIDYYKVLIPLRKDTPYVKDFLLTKSDRNVFSLRLKEGQKKHIQISCSNSVTLEVVKSFLSERKRDDILLKKSSELLYKNEVSITLYYTGIVGLAAIGSTQNIEMLVSLLYRLSKK